MILVPSHISGGDLKVVKFEFSINQKFCKRNPFAKPGSKFSPRDHHPRHFNHQTSPQSKFSPPNTNTLINLPTDSDSISPDASRSTSTAFACFVRSLSRSPNRHHEACCWGYASMVLVVTPQLRPADRALLTYSI